MVELKLSTLLVLVLLVVGLCHATRARLPGFKARLTRNGIAYANKVAQQFLSDELTSLPIPDQGGDDDHIKWTLTNIKNRGITPPTSRMTLTPAENGLTWSLENLGIKLDADWTAQFHLGLIHIDEKGTADVSIEGVDLKVTIKLGDDSKGRPIIAMAGCSANIGDIDIEFHGDLSFILNIFRSIISHKIRDVMNDKICSLVKKEIHTDAAKALARLKGTVLILHDFLLDYSLIQAPNVSSNYLEIESKGEVYWVNKTNEEAPFTPDPFPAMTGVDSKQLYLWVSEYTANTVGYVAQKHNFLRYNLTADELPEDKRSYLNTTCAAMCVGMLIPQIGKAYPNSQVEIRIRSTTAPSVTITKKELTCNTQSTIGLYAHTPSGKVAFLVSLAMNLSMSVKVAIVKERITGKIVDHSFKVAVLKSAVGHVHESSLTSSKIAGNELHSSMAVVDTTTRVSTAHYSPPVSFGRKAPSQLQRDKTRMERHRSSLVAEKNKELDGAALNTLLGAAIRLVAIPKLNKLAKKGVDLPVKDNVKFENTRVSLFTDAFVIGTDIQYGSESSQALTFRREYSVDNQL